MQSQLLLLELNEVNFEYIEAYVAQGKLPHFAHLIRNHGIARTTSEKEYEMLEPWIQWVTAHTGRSFAEHGVFRLGDITGTDIPQIWEALEERGLRVGAISPMNAKYRLKDPAFFVPDPWTRTQIRAGRTLRRLYDGLVQAVNDNAQSRLTADSIRALLAGVLVYASPRNYGAYLSLAARSIRGAWRKAMFVDLLLADVFVREVRRTAPHFASLFVNAAAHIQHHYMFCAAPYGGPHRNPPWYVREGLDPILEVYSLYDDILGNVRRAFPDARIMVATGLHQVPHEHMTFYWRLIDHTQFLQGIGIPFVRVEPRMSRDFLVTCADANQATQAAVLLKSAQSMGGTPLFEVDNRGSDLFVMLTYPRDIQKDFRFRMNSREYSGLKDQVALVALKNGEHHGTGYFVDSGDAPRREPEEFPLSEMPARIMTALGLRSDFGAIQPRG